MSKIKSQTVTRRAKEPIPKLPKGAEVTYKSHSTNIEEIENGYIVSKSVSIDYILKGENKYMSYSTKHYSKEEPILVDGEQDITKAFD